MKVESSTKKFKLDDLCETSGVADITIDEVMKLAVNQAINVIGNVQYSN